MSAPTLNPRVIRLWGRAGRPGCLLLRRWLLLELFPLCMEKVRGVEDKEGRFGGEVEEVDANTGEKAACCMLLFFLLLLLLLVLLVLLLVLLLLLLLLLLLALPRPIPPCPPPPSPTPVLLPMASAAAPFMGIKANESVLDCKMDWSA